MRKYELKMYRVYGVDAEGNSYDEYSEAYSAQRAVDKVREWYADKPNFEVLEVSRVMKGWK